jgi:hypothetical protein
MHGWAASIGALVTSRHRRVVFIAVAKNVTGRVTEIIPNLMKNNCELRN